ncbi:hypothetical protein K1T71_005185 [Dendrolimus kikuchii]|uniref:Uncharacterized protein n=1 Tax=Dendrolimus kikuchii TaxID=765133 RepID=A0ACC1D7B3_9NEOP|nr:hypothetical protein K1T71_005185 [Dendrolimus kikuchii]
MEFEQRQGTSWRWPLLISVVFLNICLSSPVLSYGVFLVHLSELNIPTWLGLAAPTLYILTYGLTQCWCREAADSWGGTIGYRVLAAVGLVIVVVSLLICAFIPLHIQPFVYGILGGLGSSLLSAQVDAVLFDTYDTRLALIRGLCFAGQAVGQALFPHIITALIDYYGYSNSFIVFAALMLQTLPAILLMRVDDSIRRPVSFSRYSDLAKTYAIFSNDNIENNYYATELQLHDLGKKCWKSPSDDNLHREFDSKDEASYDNEIVTTITPPPSPEEKRRNIFGVEILPEIPEESEESDDDEDRFVTDKDKSRNKIKRLSVAIKRLSTLGDSLDDCISKQIRRDSHHSVNSDNKEYSEVEVTYDNISPVTDIQREKIFNSFSFRCQSAYASMRRRIWMPSYRVYSIRRRLVYFMYNVNDTFVKPLTRSLSCWRFYPSLLLAFSKLSLTAISLVLLPMIGTQTHPKISTSDSNFLLSLYGFTWICFLLSMPWLATTPKRNYQYIALIGLIVSTAACFVLAEATSHDTISIGCVVAGFGYGAISTCWETTVQDYVGARKWSKIHSPLETLSSCVLTVFVIGISFIVDQKDGLQKTIFILASVLGIITVLWAVIAAIAIYVTKLRSIRLGRRWIF